MIIRATPLRKPLLAVILAALVAAMYWGAQYNNFARDDSVYLVGNPDIRKGVSAEGVLWAFTSTYQSNWHPLTWLSHLLDYQLFGLTPRGPHLVNVGLHALNSSLLFLAASALTGALWRSWLVAVLFAFHPLHVESVAWISERKDLLAGAFFLLTLLAYRRYAGKPSGPRLLAVTILFSLGLMSKPMLVTLPFVLLLLDRWPLGRTGTGTAGRLLLEKVPLFALAAASSVLTYIAQEQGGSVQSLELFPLGTRVANAIVSCAAYLGKMIWPLKLAIVYPYPSDPARMAAIAAIPLALLSAAALGVARRRPAFLTGWLWYLGMLVPVIGLVQVGIQPLADRYTYLPLIGPFMALAFLLPGRRAPWRPRIPAALGLLAALAFFGAITRAQVRTWKDDLTLYRHAAAAIDGNWEAYNFLGFLMVWAYDDREEALRCFQKALLINPESFDAHFKLGAAQVKWGQVEEAIAHLREAVRLAPDFARVRITLARALERGGRRAEALAQYEQALRLEPERTSLKGDVARLRSAKR